MIYRLDSNDAIVHVDGSFRRFAESVGLPGLPDEVLGRSLWSFIGDGELTSVYAGLVARAREGNVVQVQTRCDTPSLARTVEMDIAVRPGGEVEFTCRAGQARLISPALASGTELLRLCAWCYRAERAGVWRGLESVVADEQLLVQPTVPIVTHGICDECLADAAAVLETAA